MVQIRNVRMNIKFKLIGIIILLITSALSFYVFFAVRLFTEDKSAYIYEHSLNTAESISEQIKLSLDKNFQITKYLSAIFKNSEDDHNILKSIFERNSDLIEFAIYKKNSNEYKQIFGLSDSLSLKTYNLKNNYFLSYTKLNPIPFATIEKQKRYLEGLNSNLLIPSMFLAIYDDTKSEIYTARIKVESLADLMDKNKLYDISVFNKTGSIFLKKNNTNKIDADKMKFYNTILEKNIITEGVREFTDINQKQQLISYHKVRDFSLYVFTEISKTKAFTVATTLIDKSLYFGIFIISIAIIIGIFFSKTITSPIEKLFKATSEIAKGDFTSKVRINSSDEIGALSDSFNYMSDEILKYMDEMKEKIRLENELKVATLVQNSFFPENDVTFDNLKISAFYEPATECGGDWWGHIESGDKTVIMIADATGHGVPAALLTATANCCASNLEVIAKLNPAIIDSPSEMLEIINKAVCDVGNQILMTFFIATINSKTMELTYANASHNPPYQFRPNLDDKPISKQNLIPLMNSNGPMLGEDPNAVYKNKKSVLLKNEALIFFTDGIVECTNPENTQWGNRNFLKSIIKNISLDTSKIRDNIIDEAKTYYESQPADDDITLIVAKII